MLVTEVAASYTNIEALKPQWNDLLRSTASDTVFFAAEWLDCWLKTVGAGSQPFGVVVKENGRIVALAPLTIVECREMAIPVRRLQFIGAPQADYADFIVGGTREHCIAAIVRCIVDHDREWDYVDLSHITDESPNWQTLQQVLGALNVQYVARRLSECPYIPLDASIEDYLPSRPKALRYDLRRGEERLRELGTLQYEVLHGSRAREALPHFLEMLSRREDVTARRGQQSALRMRRSFFTALLDDPESSRVVHFCRLVVNREAIAYHFGFEYGGKLYWYKPTFEPGYSQYSPGKLLVKYSMEYALSVGLVELDLLLGDEPYKFQWTDRSRSSYCIMLFSRRARSRAVRVWLSDLKPRLKQIRQATRTVMQEKKSRALI